jgi:protoporphyrinogen oxidase
MSKYPVVIIGAGVAGLTAKKYFDAIGVESIVLEQREAVGGHAQAHEFEDHVFDEGPHILFSNDEEILDFIGAPSPTKYEEIARPLNLWKGKYLNHPAYLDLEGLGEKQVAIQIAESLLSAEIESAPLAKSYGDWLNATQGRFVREEFTEIYTRKYWRCSTYELDVDWLGGRIHAPTGDQRKILESLTETGRGNIKLPDLTENSHYLTRSPTIRKVSGRSFQVCIACQRSWANMWNLSIWTPRLCGLPTTSMATIFC